MNNSMPTYKIFSGVNGDGKISVYYQKNKNEK